MRTREYTTKGGITFTVRNVSLDAYRKFRNLANADEKMDTFANDILQKWSGSYVEEEGLTPDKSGFGQLDLVDVKEIMEMWSDHLSGSEAPLVQNSETTNS